MNPKRKPSKVVRVTESLFNEAVDIAEKYGVTKRDVIDAILEHFMMQCRKDNDQKFAIFQTFASRQAVRMKNPTGKPKPADGGERDVKGSRTVPDVPEWMR
tara:strand:+ start:408 stop:710 length:303 start_codon:yes stop_codon:yes gene_type:complete